MARFNKSFLILPIFLTFANAAPACPFSKSQLTCTCVQASSEDNFESVTCQVGSVDTLPKFNSTTGQYSVTGDLFIQFETPIAFYIEAQSFVDFSSIGRLRLQSYNGITSISWNETSLQGTRISKFLMDNIYHFNSAFAALHSDTGSLQQLELDKGGAYHLGGGDLQDFQQLQVFTISHTSISTIDQTAFSGLENVINEISLTNANVDERLFPALQGLQELKNLNLSGNDFKTFDLSALDGVSQLSTLVLDRNDQLESLQLSNLDQVPKNLQEISARRSPLKTIDQNFAGLLDRASFQMLDISNNLKGVQCDESVNFLAKYALCMPVKVDARNTQCYLSQMDLLQYLRVAAPHPC